MPRAENGWKVCARCRRNFPVSEYFKKVSNPDGHDPYCKRCRTEVANKPPEYLDIEEFVELYPKTPLRELSAKYCRAEPTITHWAGWLRKNGFDIPHRPRGGKPKERYDRKKYAKFADGKPIADIADELGISASRAQHRNSECRKAGYVIRTPKGYYK